MKVTAEHNDKIAKITFASVYPHYVNKVEKKGRTIEELNQVIKWLTGIDEKAIQELIAKKSNFSDFFKQANLNPNSYLIKGVICVQIPVKLTTLNRFKLTSEFAGEDFKFMNCFGL